MQTKRLGMEAGIGGLILLFLAVFPFIASDFRTEMMGKFIVFIIFALALDLVWGYTGLLSLGHAVFFGLGGYMLALSYVLQDGVPAFMTRFGINQIPWIMQPLVHTPVAFLLGLFLPALLAAVIGFFIFKSNVGGVYFSIITLALAQLFELLVIDLQAYTGGFNGLMGLPRFPIFGQPLELTTYYYLVFFTAAGVYVLTRWLTRSHFGKTLRAVRENENRIRFLSYNPANYKIFIFAISGFLSGLAGMLYVPVNGFISPQDIGIGMSTLLVVWLAIGGRGTLMGAVVGVLIINWMSDLLSEQYPEIWQLLIGSAIVLIVLFLPDGIYGTLHKRWNARNAGKSELDAALAQVGGAEIQN